MYSLENFGTSHIEDAVSNNSFIVSDVFASRCVAMVGLIMELSLLPSLFPHSGVMPQYYCRSKIFKGIQLLAKT
jgi:hypothetical protein